MPLGGQSAMGPLGFKGRAQIWGFPEGEGGLRSWQDPEGVPGEKRLRDDCIATGRGGEGSVRD